MREELVNNPKLILTDSFHTNVDKITGSSSIKKIAQVRFSGNDVANQSQMTPGIEEKHNNSPENEEAKPVQDRIDNEFQQEGPGQGEGQDESQVEGEDKDEDDVYGREVGSTSSSRRD